MTKRFISVEINLINMVLKITILTLLIFTIIMSGIADAEGDQTYGMMGRNCSECAECIDVMDVMDNLPFAQFDAMSATATSGIVIEEDWVYGRMNVAKNKIEYVMYDFEEGSNCKPFKNQHPEIATFLTVPTSRWAPIGYGPDYPSYSTANGSMCGTTRCFMRIYPWCGYYTNGTPISWVYIVNGNSAFAPLTCCESDECWTGNCYPGFNAKIEFKEDTNYISFLVSTGSKVYVRLYDKQRNWLGSKTVYRTIDRVGIEPSNFTRVEIHLPDKEIYSMTLSGSFNNWHIDDMIVGGIPGYLDKPVNYTYVARRAQELHGVDYLEYGLGADYEVFDYLDSWQFKDSALEEYWNPETKQFELGEGISNAGLIVWAYNYYSGELAGTSFVKRSDVAGMEKHDFKVDVDSADTQPGDVCFMDRRDRNGELGSDGYADEVYMVVEETPTEMDLITACPDSGVIYSKKSIVESSPAFMGYKRLPGVIRGGKNPIPKGH